MSKCVISIYEKYNYLLLLKYLFCHMSCVYAYFTIRIGDIMREPIESFTISPRKGTFLPLSLSLS